MPHKLRPLYARHRKQLTASSPSERVINHVERLARIKGKPVSHIVNLILRQHCMRSHRLIKPKEPRHDLFSTLEQPQL